MKERGERDGERVEERERELVEELRVEISRIKTRKIIRHRSK